MKKAIGYVRVSTTEQAVEGISLDNQKGKIETYCRLNDLELSGIIEDSGKSGKNLNRERKLPHQVDSCKVEFSAFSAMYSAGVKSPNASWGRSSL